MPENSFIQFYLDAYQGGYWNKGSHNWINSNIEDFQWTIDWMFEGIECDGSACQPGESNGWCCPEDTYCGNINCGGWTYENWGDNTSYPDGTGYDGPEGWGISAHKYVDLTFENCFDEEEVFSNRDNGN